MIDIKGLDFDKTGGIIPAVVQDARTKEVLMLGYMDKAALRLTLTERRAVFWSRSRKRLWRKGDESGNFMSVISVTQDCDGDALLIGVKPAGPACHTGDRSCFKE